MGALRVRWLTLYGFLQDLERCLKIGRMMSESTLIAYCIVAEEEVHRCVGEKRRHYCRIGLFRSSNQALPKSCSRTTDCVHVRYYDAGHVHTLRVP